MVYQWRSYPSNFPQLIFGYSIPFEFLLRKPDAGLHLPYLHVFVYRLVAGTRGSRCWSVGYNSIAFLCYVCLRSRNQEVVCCSRQESDQGGKESNISPVFHHVDTDYLILWKLEILEGRDVHGPAWPIFYM